MNTSSSQPTFRTRRNESLRKNVRSKFTEIEDQIITTMVNEYKNANVRIHWSEIANKLINKTGSDVSHRWNTVLNPEIIKGSWTPKEDLIVIDWVKQNGAGKWNLLQRTCLPQRSGKQIRERWVNILSPSIQVNNISIVENALKNSNTESIENNEKVDIDKNKKIKNENVKINLIMEQPIKNDPWTQEEDDLLKQLFIEFGPKWKKISSFIAGRSENSVKNRMQSIKKQCFRILLGKDPLMKRGRRKKNRSLLMMQNNDIEIPNISDSVYPKSNNRFYIDAFDDIEFKCQQNTESFQITYSPLPISLSCSQPINYESIVNIPPPKILPSYKLFDDL